MSWAQGIGRSNRPAPTKPRLGGNLSLASELWSFLPVSPSQPFQQLAGVDDLGGLVGFSEVPGVAGDDVVGSGSVRAFVEAIIFLVVGDLQRLRGRHLDGYVGQGV